MSYSTMHEAKTNLSRLIELAERGEEVVITRGKKPVARIVAIEKPTARDLAIFKGQFRVEQEFFEPLPEDELRRWNGENE
jgi:prevent-host-death family protein